MNACGDKELINGAATAAVPQDAWAEGRPAGCQRHRADATAPEQLVQLLLCGALAVGRDLDEFKGH
jgi:hypothetical protein